MELTSEKLRLTPQIAVACSNVLALFAFLLSPNAHLYPMAIVGIIAFTLIHLFLPACWVNLDSPICPGNFAQFFFWIQVVLVPVLIGYYGPTLGTLSHLPPDSLINFAIGLRVLGYVFFSLGFQFLSWPSTTSAKSNNANRVEPISDVTMALLAAFALIGLIGWWFNYGGIGGFIAYATSPEEQRLRDEEATSITGALGNLLRHFLGFAIVWAWSEWIQRRDRVQNLLPMLIATAAVVCMLILANFSYNRGSMAVPILATAAAFSQHVRRISFTIAATGGTLLLAFAFIFGEYRATSMEVSEFSMDQVSSLNNQQGIVDEIQIYGAGPQLAATILEGLETESHTQKSGTLLSSLLYPLPIFGKPYRETSGVVRFNHMIYGDVDNYDQNIPYDAELYLNFQGFGVAVGYLLIGGLVAFVHRKFLFAQQPITSYAWLTLGIWLVFPASFPVLAQICIYSLWPIYAYAVYESAFLTVNVGSDSEQKEPVLP